MSVIKKIAVFCFVFIYIPEVFAQNEASKAFIPGTVLATQAGSSLNKFPKLEIGFVGRNAVDTGAPTAFLFVRFNSSMEIGGGMIYACYSYNEKLPGDTVKQFAGLLADFVALCQLASEEDATLDKDFGEIELTDFQWYMTENQWKFPYNKTCRIKVKAQTVDGQNRFYLYRTSSIKDSKNEFMTFTMPNDTYLTEKQCTDIVNAYDKKGSFFWKAVDAAVASVKKTIR